MVSQSCNLERMPQQQGRMKESSTSVTENKLMENNETEKQRETKTKEHD